MPPLRVVYLCHTSAPGGSAGSLRHLIAAFPRDQVQAVVCCPPGPAAEAFRAAGAEVRVVGAPAMLLSIHGVPLKGWRLLQIPRALLQLGNTRAFARVLDEVRPDLVHLNERGMFDAARVARKRGIPVVMHARSVADRTTRWADRLTRSLTERYVTELLPIDESVRRALGGVRVPMTVVYNPLASVPDAPLPARNGPGLRVGFLTGLLPFKGIWDLLEAARQLADRPDIIFRIAGKNSRPPEFFRGLPGRISHRLGLAMDVEAQVKDWITAQGAGARVEMLGHVEDQTSFFRSIDLLVFPSHLDGPGRSVFEAGVHGLPSVVALRTPVQDIVQDGTTGVIIPPRAPMVIAETLRRLADHPGLRLALGEAARRKYQRQFDPAAIALRVLEVYRRLARPR